VKVGGRNAIVAGLLVVGTVVVFPVATNLVSNDLSDWLRSRPAMSWVIKLAAAVIGIGLAFVWLRSERDRLKKEFGVFADAEKLRPEDVGFEVVAAGGDTADSMKRPYVNGVYVPRHAVRWDERHAAKPSITYNEGSLLAELRDGNNILLVARPTDGKTRTLYEIVRQLHGWVVVKPMSPPPSADAFELLRNKDVVCLFDDINTAQAEGVYAVNEPRP